MRKSEQQHNPAVIDDLRLLYRHLEIVRSGIVVAAEALRHQNADRDADIAQVLEHLVGERLADQIARTAQLLDALGASESYATRGETQSDSIDPSGAIREFPRPWPRASAHFLAKPVGLPGGMSKSAGTSDFHSKASEMYMCCGPLVSMDRTLRGRGKAYAPAGLRTGAPGTPEAAGVHAGVLCTGM